MWNHPACVPGNHLWRQPGPSHGRSTNPGSGCRHQRRACDTELAQGPEWYRGFELGSGIQGLRETRRHAR